MQRDDPGYAIWVASATSVEVAQQMGGQVRDDWLEIEIEALDL